MKGKKNRVFVIPIENISVFSVSFPVRGRNSIEGIA